MKRTLATAGHMALAAAPRLHAACGADAAYSWHVNPSIHSVNQTATVMDVFDTSKPARRPKESSP
jgi:hypothetical protein